MALTLEREQQLESVGLVDLYEKHAESWNDMAREAYEYAERGFPDGSLIRRDDVGKFLIPTLEVNETFMAHRDLKKLRPKRWVEDFANLIIDRCWDSLTQPKEEEQQA